MSYIRTLFTLTLMNLRTIPSRGGSSIVIVVGIGGVVAVLVSLLSMAEGFDVTLKETGRDDRALILRSGSISEINGNIPLDQYPIIAEAPEVASQGGKKLAAMETFVTVKLPAKKNSALNSITMRGVSNISFAVRDEFTILKGKQITQGQYELLAGIGAHSQVEGLNVGSTINIRGVDWLIVGHFATNGSVYESELWVPERLLANLYNRGETFSSMLVMLTSTNALDTFRTRAENDRRLKVNVQRESTYFADQSAGTTNLIKGVGGLLAAIMSIGAVFAALNTMHSAVSNRRREIATLRALGFHRLPVVFTILTESMVLATIGGCIGALLVYFMFNGFAVSTVNGTYTQVSFRFMVTLELLLQGLKIALFLGILGGVLPAISAARESIVNGLRA